MSHRPLPDDTTRIERPGDGGKVRRDSQGNAVWQWAAATGRQALDSTSRLLRRLEVPGLKLLDDGRRRELGTRRERRRARFVAGLRPLWGSRRVGGGARGPRSRGVERAEAAQRNVKAKPSLLSRLLGRR